MARRINITADDETAKRVALVAEEEDRTESGAALRLIKEALDARDKARVPA